MPETFTHSLRRSPLAVCRSLSLLAYSPASLLVSPARALSLSLARDRLPCLEWAGDRAQLSLHSVQAFLPLLVSSSSQLLPRLLSHSVRRHCSSLSALRSSLFALCSLQPETGDWRAIEPPAVRDVISALVYSSLCTALRTLLSRRGLFPQTVRGTSASLTGTGRCMCSRLGIEIDSRRVLFSRRKQPIEGSFSLFRSFLFSLQWT